ncbi:MAG: LLM class flavin-dependent oxidoreductase [Acidobacteriota bacterium]|nr:LLM class flavin-dependent oxidoreductase [Acidobacteriota bacterium]
MTNWGVLLPTFDPLRLGEPFAVAEAARLAEQAGYDSIWVGDHLKCPAPVLDAPTCLAVAAAVTARVQLGFSVMLLGLRPLAWTAKQLATLQHLSGNRLRLGVGVGGEFPQEYTAAEVPLSRRGARLDAALTRLPQYLAAGGEHALEPSAPLPPVLVGGRSDRALERAARFGDAWLPMWVSPETLGQRAERLAERSQAHGRPTPGLSLLVLAHVDEDAARARAQAQAHLCGQYGIALERVERWTAFGPAAAVAEFLERYTRVGVDEILLLPLGARPLEQIERLAAASGAIRSLSDAP